MAAPRVTETYSASAGGAAIGLVQWALARYAFGGHEPAPVTAAVFILLPAVLGGITAFFTRRDSKQAEPPSAAGPATAPTTAAGPGPAV